MYGRRQYSYSRAPVRRSTRRSTGSRSYARPSSGYSKSRYSRSRSAKVTSAKRPSFRRALGHRLRRRFRSHRRFHGRSNQLAIIPDRYFCKLVYTDHRQSASGGATSALQQFRGNSLFDPDFTNTGGQPRGFPKLAALYGFYRVYASQIKLRFASPTGIPTAQSLVGLAVMAHDKSGDVTTASDPQKEEELPRCKAMVVRYGSTDQPIAQIKKMYKTRAIFGVDKQTVISDDLYGAAVTANPTNSWFWSIFWRNGDDATAANMFIWTKLTFYCEFYNRLEITS